MSVNGMPALAQSNVEIQSDSGDIPMSQYAEPNAGPDAKPDAEQDSKPNAKPDAERDAKLDIRRMSQQRQMTPSPNSTELRTWISKNEWANFIKDDPHDPLGRSTSAVSIFRVPEFMKNTKKEAYVPQRVSLGPYHHRIAKFSPMGHYKGRALRGMMEKYNREKEPDSDSNKEKELVSDSNEEKELDSDPNNINMEFANRAKEEIRKVEKEIRDSYEEKIACDGETLSLILSLDGCFLLQVLRTLGRKGRDIQTITQGALEKEYDGTTTAQLFSISKPFEKENGIIEFALIDILNDILMLENQVPFIVLRKLLQLEFKSTDDIDRMLLEMVTGCIWRLLKPYCADTFIYIEQWYHEKLADKKKFQHLLGFLYKAIVHSGPIEKTDRGTMGCIPIGRLGRRNRQHQDGLNEAPNQSERIRPAVELRNAGIKFKPSHEGIKKIKFDQKSATIFLPPICITDITDVLFRNLIAFEVCRSSKISYVSCYVNIMDNLIDSQKDVALLRRMGILTNWLGRDNEVVDLFNSLSKATVHLNLLNAFHQLTEEVNAHYEKEIRVQLQLPKLVQDYCSTPWKALASAAAIVLLLLTLLQTIFSIISVYK